MIRSLNPHLNIKFSSLIFFYIGLAYIYIYTLYGSHSWSTECARELPCNWLSMHTVLLNPLFLTQPNQLNRGTEESPGGRLILLRSLETRSCSVQKPNLIMLPLKIPTCYQILQQLFWVKNALCQAQWGCQAVRKLLL